jgi:hypothetical protein
MIGALAFSVVASGLFSFIDIGPRRIRYWRRFVGSYYWPAQIGLVVIYALAGLGGWFLNKEYIVHPDPSAWLLNGLLSLGIGQAILRIDPTLLEVDGRGPARSLLVGAQRFLFDDIEDNAFTAVFNSIRMLSDDELVQLALDIARVAVIKDDVPEGAQVQVLETLTDAAEEVKNGNSPNGRSRLVQFSVKMITENRYVYSF